MLEGKLLSIAIREKSRAAMVELSSVEVSIEAGLAGDSRGRPGDRQVTVMSRECWELACGELATILPWTTRRANLLVEGLALEAKTGRQIRIGEVVLQICGETDPCERMDQQVPGLTKALLPDWRGGVCCRVLSGGTLKVDDPARLNASEMVEDVTGE